MKSSFLKLAFLIAISSTCYSQTQYLNGFIVVNNGDTLKGEILNQVNTVFARSCQFRSGSDPVIYYPGEISGFGLYPSNRLFKSKEVTLDEATETVFLEYLVDGIADLFYLNLDNKEYYFLQKGEEFLPLLNPVKEVQVVDQQNNTTRQYNVTKELYKGIMTYAFEDQVPGNLISNARYDPKSLTMLTTKYHNAVCDWECSVFRRNTKSKISIIPHYTAESARLKFNTQGSGSATDFHSGYGVLLKVSSYKSEFISLITGLEYASTQFRGNFTNKLRFTYFNTDSVLIDQKILTIPAFVRWAFIKNKRLEGFLTGGITNQLILSGSYQVYEEYGTNIIAPQRSYQTGLLISPGMTFWVTKKAGLTLSPYLEKTFVPANTGRYFDRIWFTSFGATIGLELSLN